MEHTILIHLSNGMGHWEYLILEIAINKVPIGLVTLNFRFEKIDKYDRKHFWKLVWYKYWTIYTNNNC